MVWFNHLCDFLSACTGNEVVCVWCVCTYVQCTYMYMYVCVFLVCIHVHVYVCVYVHVFDVWWSTTSIVPR